MTLPSDMLELTPIAPLDVSAASGIVAFGERLFVVADDELFLAIYDANGIPIERVALFAGELPEPHAERKRAKPDLEALMLLPDGRLLALGSGSTANRNRAALITPPTAGGAWGVRPIDLQPLYDALSQRIPELNIEGAVVHAGRLWLAQRGNGAAGVNACIELDLARALESLTHEHALSASALCTVHPVALGELDGTALSLTDLTADPDAGLLFAAAAEASPNTYDDGVCTGSAIGMLALDGKVQRSLRVSPVCKVEGLAIVHCDAKSLELRVVADADDRAKLAPLYRATLLI